MNSALDILFLRRPVIDYVSPSVCDVLFSSSGSPVIVLEDINPISGITGFEWGGTGSFHLSWDSYPGAICYSVYKAVDELDPFGAYAVIAECISDLFFDADSDGWYRVSVLTPDGESPLTDPIHVVFGGGGLNPTVEVGGLSNIGWLADNGTVVGSVEFGARPGYFKGSTTSDTRSTVDSSPITAAQVGMTVTSSLSFFSIGDIGKGIRFLSGEFRTITGFTSSQIVTVSPGGDVPATTFLLQGHTLGGSFGIVSVVNASDVMGVLETISDDSVQDNIWYDFSGGEYRDLGDSNNGFPVDIDEAGFILFDSNPGFTGHKAVLYDSSLNSFTDQGSLGSQATPAAMNASHVIAMRCDTTHADTTTWLKACRAFGGVVTVIHPAEAAKSGWPNDNSDGNSFAYSINSAGHIFGGYEDPNDSYHNKLFYWDGAVSTAIPTPPGVDAEPAQGNSGQPVGINDSNTVAGSYGVVPFTWNPSTGFTLIPLLPTCTEGYPSAINNAGWVVGYMISGGFHKPFLFRNGATESILTLVSAIDAGWTDLVTADFVNNNKQIVGLGTHNGETKVYRLTLV